MEITSVRDISNIAEAAWLLSDWIHTHLSNLVSLCSIKKQIPSSFSSLSLTEQQNQNAKFHCPIGRVVIFPFPLICMSCFEQGGEWFKNVHEGSFVWLNAQKRILSLKFNFFFFCSARRGFCPYFFFRVHFKLGSTLIWCLLIPTATLS